tara:strand:+ start:4208 stop:4939 length:732 start_codon:yes stop_codon:yes gene_type:complete
MKNTAIIIPTRLGAKRFPNKPLARINNIPMIVHVFNRAKESKVGDVYVATPDKQIVDIVTQNGGKAILTNDSHYSGSDRIHEVYKKYLQDKVDLIINLQGDMPNIKSSTILKLEKLMRSTDSEIGTMASYIKNENEIKNENIVKVAVEKGLTKDSFLTAKDFFRISKNQNNEKIYHHIGIYAFTSTALTKYVMFSRTKLEIERNLEQMRALENNMIIKVGLSDSTPLGVDTEEDLNLITKEMK